MSQPPFPVQAIIFDFDGVLVESTAVKDLAFVELYKDQPEDIRQQVLQYHRDNGGVSRYVKIRYYEEELLGRSVTQDGIDALAQKFSDIVEAQVVGCSYVKGAREFLEEHASGVPCSVASGTPEDELRRIVEKRGMAGYFGEVCGSPTSKYENIEGLVARGGYDPSKVLMVGDAVTDYEGAMKAGTLFLGRVAPDHVSPFPEDTVVVPDLRNLPDLIRVL